MQSQSRPAPAARTSTKRGRKRALSRGDVVGERLQVYWDTMLGQPLPFAVLRLVKTFMQQDRRGQNRLRLCAVGLLSTIRVDHAEVAR